MFRPLPFRSLRYSAFCLLTSGTALKCRQSFSSKGPDQLVTAIAELESTYKRFLFLASSATSTRKVGAVVFQYVHSTQHIECDLFHRCQLCICGGSLVASLTYDSLCQVCFGCINVRVLFTLLFVVCTVGCFVSSYFLIGVPL